MPTDHEDNLVFRVFCFDDAIFKFFKYNQFIDKMIRIGMIL